MATTAIIAWINRWLRHWLIQAVWRRALGQRRLCSFVARFLVCVGWGKFGPTRRARGQGRALPSLPGILGLWRVHPGAFFCQIPPLPVTLVRYSPESKIRRDGGFFVPPSEFESLFRPYSSIQCAGQAEGKIKKAGK